MKIIGTFLFKPFKKLKTGSEIKVLFISPHLSFSLEISYEDAFRIMDMDFDGIITKPDLKQFLIKTIEIHEN